MKVVDDDQDDGDDSLAGKSKYKFYQILMYPVTHHKAEEVVYLDIVMILSGIVEAFKMANKRKEGRK